MTDSNSPLIKTEEILALLRKIAVQHLVHAEIVTIESVLEYTLPCLQFIDSLQAQVKQQTKDQECPKDSQETKCS